MSITGANAVFMLTIPDVFPAPLKLQGFAADDVCDTEPQEIAETLMGVDGNQSAGFVFNSVKQVIALQADSPSISLFDAWAAAQRVARAIFEAQGVIILTDLGIKWVLVDGVMTTYPPIPNIKKLLQPRRFGMTWESVSPAIT